MSEEFSRMGKKKKMDYLSSWGALYGDEKPRVPKVRAAPKKAPTARIYAPTEDQEQIALVTWLKYNNIKHFHPANGGYRNFYEGAKLKRMGVSLGIPDIVIPIASNGFHSLYIELKRVKGSKILPQQKEWNLWLNANGFKAVFSYGAIEAQKVVEEYLNLNKT